MSISYVYVVENKSSYKIGKSDNPKLRMSTLQTSHTDELKLLYKIEFNSSEEAVIAEKELHNYFSECRIKGEWFRLVAEDLFWIRRTYRESLTRVNASQFEGYNIGIDFIDTFAAMSNNERFAVRILKDGIKWDKELNSFNYVVNLTEDSMHFNTDAEDTIPYRSFLEAYQSLHKQDLVRRIKRGYYMMNPDFFIINGEQTAYFERVWAESKRHADAPVYR